jgi:hypothetical protein
MASDNIDGIGVIMKRIGIEIPPWDEEQGWNHVKYSVTIANERGEANFPFWGSYDDYQHNRDPSPLDALASYVLDAQSYAETKDVDDFAEEYGYTKPSRAIQAYNGCKEAFEHFLAMGYDETDLATLDEDIQKRLDA